MPERIVPPRRKGRRHRGAPKKGGEGLQDPARSGAPGPDATPDLAPGLAPDRVPRARRGKRLWRWLKRLLVGLLFLLGALAGLVWYAYETTAIPAPNPSTLQQSNVYYWSDGSVMATHGSVNRVNITLDQVSVPVQRDFLAAENADFYHDSGVDPTGIVRSLVNMVQGHQLQSGSTITQQFVKNSYLSQRPTIGRKLQELLIAVKIGDVYTKPQIFTGYLNTSYFGRDAYGLDAAARAYYGVGTSELTVSQGAFLAATVNEPSLYQNVDSDARARVKAVARWHYVLDRMVKDGWMTAAERARYPDSAFPTPRPWIRAALTGQTGYLYQLATDYAQQHAGLTDQQLAHGGYHIYTTFDRTLTEQLAAAVTKEMASAADPKDRKNLALQAGAASIDPTTGRILAVYGGPGWDKGAYNDIADSAGLQAGSTFQPVVLAAALTHGAVRKPGTAPSAVSPDSVFNGNNDIEIYGPNGFPLRKPGRNAGPLLEQNDRYVSWGELSLRSAMQHSVITPYVQLGEDVGYPAVKSTAEALGALSGSLASDSADFYAGSSTISPIRLASMYGTFADQGLHISPYSVTRITYNGLPLSGLTAPAPVRAVTPAVSGLVTGLLEDAASKDGTGRRTASLQRSKAGKTGTDDLYHPDWFVGYTGGLATAVTMFTTDTIHPGLSPVGTNVGSDFPTEAWTAFTARALQGKPDLPLVGSAVATPEPTSPRP
ncbi:transglycosylase domain-containing protein [Streptacidiphilus melanogenes]|uniref:transglycosylase domain-containing protein n=1 Tax=Streptacidiphilus melanogenes TaxID=411235 RepID=UPI001364BE24|nr:transglycosylase domain-containing protein [Streptacidiphilus melanogenes]